MTDEATGTANEGTDAAAIAAAAAAAAGGNQTAEEIAAAAASKGSDDANAKADPFAALETDTRTWFEKKHGKDPAKAVKQAYELDKLIGKSIVIPDENATDEQKADFAKKLGVPDTEDGYGFKVPTNLPPELPYDGDQDKAFAKACREAGVPVAAANKVREWFIQSQVDAFGQTAEQAKEGLKTLITAETGKLEKAWGPRDGETFKANVEFADRFFTTVDTSGELKGAIQKAGWLGPKGEILNSALATAFAKAGQALFMEDGQIRGNAADLDNPFAKATFNFTKASQLVKNDPGKAKSLAISAGADLRQFGLD
jgi:hypothetical protein